MYTWGYIKECSLGKLDLTEAEADVQNLLSLFPYYANEVITQVCSSVKPKCTFVDFVVTKEDLVNGVTVRHMPDDFVSFGDDVCTITETDVYGQYYTREAHDDDFTYRGYNQVQLHLVGTYHISYNARWYTFTKSLDNSTQIDVPNDILECIPSYIASQGFKIDNEYKSSVFRNEYEMFLARIDNTNFRNTKTLKISGGW